MTIDENPRRTIEYPAVSVLPDQPDARLKAHLFNGPLPATHAARLEVALSLAVSCLTLYMDPQGSRSPYLPADDNGKYAGEVIDEVTYLRLAPLEKGKP